MNRWSCSPPAWGWSVYPREHDHRRDVLPTRVGMVRRPCLIQRWPRRAPHPRGDGPAFGGKIFTESGCSPPAWGWSEMNTVRALDARVLPTRVGMVRLSATTSATHSCAPHPRGDGPKPNAKHTTTTTCSPPAWGWSVWVSAFVHLGGVLPTRVGMVRPRGYVAAGYECAPHPRGDGPVTFTELL